LTIALAAQVSRLAVIARSGFGDFEETLTDVENVRVRVVEAREALQQHRTEHGC
jgi:hypothetical protein